MKLIDRILTEILNKNRLGEIKHIAVNSNGKKELLKNYEEEFKLEFEEQGRKPNMFDLEDHFGMKIIVDESIKNSEEYKLFAEV